MIVYLGDVDFYINGGFHQPSCGADSLQIFREFPTPLSLAQLPVEGKQLVLSLMFF